MEEIEFSRWLFEGRLRQGKNVLPNGLNWLCYSAGNSKSHHENSIPFIFLESPHQIDMKNVVKSSKRFFGYFNTLETHSEIGTQAALCQQLSRNFYGRNRNDICVTKTHWHLATLLSYRAVGPVGGGGQFLPGKGSKSYLSKGIQLLLHQPPLDL